MLDDDLTLPIRVTDLKQWVYCPRIFYYQACLPKIRPVTYKMKAGVEAGQAEEGREERRSLRVYGLEAGEREYNLPVRSTRLGLRGEVDMVITMADTAEVIPVDYKLSRIPGLHFQLQVAAYGVMLEEMRGVTVRRGFLYSIPDRKAEEVRIDRRLREKVEKAIEVMGRILEREEMPPPTPNLRKCVACEFRRFCNDVV
jgi:CRISPR-associated exonuclease Cas4